jgi:uncharacterized protein (TIGR02246 family)
MTNQWSRCCRGSVLLGVVLVLCGAGLDSAGFGATLTAANQVEAAEGSSQSVSRQADEASVRLLVTQSSDAWKRGDVDSLAAVWAHDGELVAGDGSYHNGRPAIAKYLAQLLTGFWKGSRFVASVTSLRFPLPDVALMHLDAGFLLPDETELAPERRASVSIVAVRDGATWRLSLYHSTRLRPPSNSPGNQRTARAKDAL